MATRPSAARRAEDLTCMERVKFWFSFKKPKRRFTQVEQIRAMGGLVTQDTYQMIRGGVMFLMEMFKVVMACLLSIVVPQRCDPTPSDPEPHTCGISEIFYDISKYKTFVLVWNFITLGVSVFHYFVVSRREMYLIKYLDEDNSKPDLNLPTVIDRYPEININLLSINRLVLVSATLTLIAFVVNSIVSAYLVFNIAYDGFRTATVFATNVLLIVTVIEKALFHAWAGIQKKIALSCIEFEPVSFNVIDPDYDMPIDRRSTVDPPSKLGSS